MMQFIRKSLVRKLFIKLIVSTLLIAGGLYYYIAYYLKKDFSEFIVTPNMLFVSLGVFALIVLFFFYFDISRPFKIILTQVQSLMLSKPYKRIYTTRIDEVGVLAHFFNQVTKGISKVSSDIVEHERMLDELTIAAQLQRDILPLESPDINGLQIVAKNKAASEVGGDTFDIAKVKDKTFIYVGDVTGHGVAAGLIMTMTHSLISVFSDMYDNPFDILVNVNKYIKKHVKRAMYMTLVMMCWDEKLQKLTFVGAGHEHILVFRAATGECEKILSGGIALGMVPDNSKIIKENEIKLDIGDLVILYSDGIIEARNDNGELYGLDNLVKSVKKNAIEHTAEAVNYRIATDVTEFMGSHKQDDDMTLIVLKRVKIGEKVKVDKSTSWNA